MKKPKKILGSAYNMGRDDAINKKPSSPPKDKHSKKAYKNGFSEGEQSRLHWEN